MSSNKTRSYDKHGGMPPKPALPHMKTRSTAPTTPSREEIIDQPYNVKDAQSGRTHLDNRLLVPVGEPLDHGQLATALLHITQLPSVPKLAIEAIRAVAFILEDNHTSGIAESIANKFIVAISPKLASLQASSSDLQSSVDTYKQTTTNVTSALDQLRNTTADFANKISSNSNLTQPHLSLPSRSYSDALRYSTTSSNKVHEVLRRAEVRARQILITPIEGQDLFSENDTNDSVAHKLQTAIDVTRVEDDPQVIVKAVLLLHNKGILFEVDTVSAANWIKQAKSKDKLIDNLKMPAEIRDRHYSIIVPYVPISFKLDDSTYLNRLEAENDIPQNCIVSARWIKPKHRRANGQKSAYAVLSFSDPCHANTLIRDGLILNREKLHPRKDKREPTRCVRCQKWGHIARTCRAQKDVCGTYGNNHRTDTCNNTANIFCANCKTDDHPSHSRDCPEFEARCTQLDNHNPENQMPYYPTDETWTQVLLPPKGAPYVRPQFTQQPRNPTFRQTTLNLGGMVATKSLTQRAQKSLRASHSQVTEATESTPARQRSRTPSPPPPFGRLHSPPPPKTPDQTFHSVSSNEEIDTLIRTLSPSHV